MTGRWRHVDDPCADFAGRTVIVTGPSIGGLGFETALKIAMLGADKMILAARSKRSGEAAKKAIELKTGRNNQVEVWQLDMDSYESIKTFANRVAALDNLDVAILNAGVFMVDYRTSSYGWEETLQVNVLSSTLLALLLLPKLRQSHLDPVLEFVNSGRHRVVTANSLESRLQSSNLLAAYNAADSFSSNGQYAISKLLQMYVMQTLARWMRPEGVAEARPRVLVMAVCPGACRSQLSRGYEGFWINILRRVIFLVLRTQEQGARILVSGVLQGPEAHGQFFREDGISR